MIITNLIDMGGSVERHYENWWLTIDGLSCSYHTNKREPIARLWDRSTPGSSHEIGKIGLFLPVNKRHPEETIIRFQKLLLLKDND